MTGHGAKLLAAFLASLAASSPRTFSDRHRTVIELGAGTGLAGIAAALIGSSRVLLTEKSGQLYALERTVALNRVKLDAREKRHKGALPATCDILALTWGNVDDIVRKIEENQIFIRA